MKTIIALTLFTLLISCSNENERQTPENTKTMETSMDNQVSQLVYPPTVKGEVIDTYFNTKIADPYRWLEDDRSKETAEWVKSQNKTTFQYLKGIPYRDQLRKRLRDVWDYEKTSAPFKEGDYTYFYKNDGLQNHYVIYRQKDGGEIELFLDPNNFSEDGTTSLATLSFSKDGSLAAYTISEAGADWRKIIIIDALSKVQLEEALIDVKFSGISWKGNEGFYYSSYDKPEGSELSAITDQHKLYYHKLGQTQDQDIVVFGGTTEQRYRYVFGDVTEDGRYLLIQGAVSTTGNTLYLKDLTQENSALITIQGNTHSDTYLLDNIGTKLFLVTNLNAPNQKIITVDVQNPTAEHWIDFIAETDNVLSASTGGGYIFAEYMVDAASKIYQYNYQGKKIKEVVLPGFGSAGSLSGKADDKTLYYTFTNYKTPSTIYAYDVAKGESSIYRKSSAKFNSNDYVSSQVFYSSKDGTKIPMMITHRKGIAIDGKNPTILFGYGGFNISLTPRFRLTMAVWMEQGGIYAVPNLRGGGEYGQDWHNAGIKMHKQNVFDDFIAAAEYLIENNYTSSQYLAIYGGSNGGLLVGAVMTQRPELMRVAIPAVGVLDMLRYHTFTSGAGWAYDYGTAEDSKEMFEYIRKYSPVHNVNQGTRYPATLITTGDHDDRVVPAHSFKFAAVLQEKQSGNAPILIRIETNAGHGAGTPVSKTIDLYADIFAFALYNMGIESLPE